MVQIQDDYQGSTPRPLPKAQTLNEFFGAKAVLKLPHHGRLGQGRLQTPNSHAISKIFGQVAVQSPETWTNHKFIPIGASAGSLLRRAKLSTKCCSKCPARTTHIESFFRLVCGPLWASLGLWTQRTSLITWAALSAAPKTLIRSSAGAWGWYCRQAAPVVCRLPSTARSLQLDGTCFALTSSCRYGACLIQSWVASGWCAVRNAAHLALRHTPSASNPHPWLEGGVLPRLVLQASRSAETQTLFCKIEPWRPNRTHSLNSNLSFTYFFLHHSFLLLFYLIFRFFPFLFLC